MKTNIFFLVISFLFYINCSQESDIAEITAPIAFNIANNAIKNNTENGRFLIDLNFQNITQNEGDWPSGTIIANITIPSSKQEAKVTYILSGSYTATAIVEVKGKDRKQYPINFIESTIIFGQTQTLENYLKKIIDKLSIGLKKENKIVVFDAESLNKNKNSFGSLVSESFVTNLVDKGMIVLERRLLDSVINEINFQSTGLTSDEVRIKIGNFLGGDTLILSTLKASKAEVIINSRSIDIKSGRVLSTAQEIIPRYLISLIDQKGLD